MKRIFPSSLTEDILNIHDQELIILSTYLTSKMDPQRNIFQEDNDYKYIKNWYESILEHNLIAFVFYDELSDDFVRRYGNFNVRFMKCQLGLFSLNDERFFIYHEFLESFRQDIFVISTDINDVVVNKNPLPLFKTMPDKIFVGRGNILSWNLSFYTLTKLREFNVKMKGELSSAMLLFPVFNAGLIAGKARLILELFKKMMAIFDLINDDGNYNAPVLNYVLYRDYYAGFNKYTFMINGFYLNWYYYFYRYRLLRKLVLFNLPVKFELSSREDSIVVGSILYSGFPFNSMFKRFENKYVSDAYLIHK